MSGGTTTVASVADPAWLTEDVDFEMTEATGLLEEQGDAWLAATFSASAGADEEVEGLTLDEALAWARSRSEQVIVRLGDRRRLFSAGTEPIPGLPAWPPQDLALPLVRRRPGPERWKDRTGDDEPIPWCVVVAVQHDWEHVDEVFREDGQTDARIAEAAGRTGAIAWDREMVDAFLADVQRTSPGGMWTTASRPAWRLRYEVDAPSRDLAAAQVRAALGPWPGFELAIDARPTDTWIDGFVAATLEEERAAFDRLVLAAPLDPGAEDRLLAALDVLARIEPQPTPAQLHRFLTDTGLEIGDNHLSTAEVEWLPVLDDPQGRWLLVELDEHRCVERIHVVRGDRTDG